ncbi:OmpA family protein [Pedobacter punctiformis]|uniref:OmpA family protein n=1 Tax=Pedobacter punctiformis TaxID=3004097 RepID=A0ABT4L834_9SPHI|nr:OmpA family protein [Pedobacter sp. HCMS5-2]MCZ4244078.1 OmpA family protein [Pedobacter sp. HCMS5-2]
MNILKKLSFTALITLFTLGMYSCKTKKMVAKPDPVPAAKPTPPVEEKKPEPVKEPEKPAPVEKPNYNFENIQFEFNSFVLKTASFPILDKIVVEIKKDPAVKFVLNGHSSAEGTPEHNMSLSVDRANAVKSYLINAGIDPQRFTISGHGDKEPVSTNSTEEGRALNRRVQINAQI